MKLNLFPILNLGDHSPVEHNLICPKPISKA